MKSQGSMILLSTVCEPVLTKAVIFFSGWCPFSLPPGAWHPFNSQVCEDFRASLPGRPPCKMELLLCGCLHAFLSGSLCIWFRRMDLQWDSKVLCFTSQARVSVLYFTLTCLHTSPIGAHLRTAG